MRRRIRRGGELLSLAMAIMPGSGHCSSLCTQELEMKPKHSSGLRILLLLPRLPQAPLLLLPLARSLAPELLLLLRTRRSLWIYRLPRVRCSRVPCIRMSAVEKVLFSAPAPSPLSRGRKPIIGTHCSVLAIWRFWGLKLAKCYAFFVFYLPNFYFIFLNWTSSSRWAKKEKGDDSLV